MLVCCSGVQVDLLYQHKSCSSSQYSLASNCSFRSAGYETLLICLTACQTMLWMAVIPKAPWLQTAGLSLALEVLSVTCAWAAHLCCSADSIAHADLEQSSHQYCLFAARPISLMLMSRHRLYCSVGLLSCPCCGASGLPERLSNHCGPMWCIPFTDIYGVMVRCPLSVVNSHNALYWHGLMMSKRCLMRAGKRGYSRPDYVGWV